MKDILINRDPKLQVRVSKETRNALKIYAEKNFWGNISKAMRHLIEQGLRKKT